MCNRRSLSIRDLLNQVLGQLKLLTQEIHGMATGTAVLTSDVSNLVAAVTANLQSEASLISALVTAQQALAAAVAGEDPAAIAAASSSIEALTAQLNTANTNAQTALGVQPPAPAVQAA